MVLSKRVVRAQYPEGSRPKALSSFDLPRTPFSQRLKIAVVIADGWEDDYMVWAAMNKVADGRLDVVVNVQHPNDAAARWGHWHYMPVRSYGTAEEDEFMQECDVLLIVGPKSDEMLQYYRDLAKFYTKPSKWASPKE